MKNIAAGLALGILAVASVAVGTGLLFGFIFPEQTGTLPAVATGVLFVIVAAMSIVSVFLFCGKCRDERRREAAAHIAVGCDVSFLNRPPVR
jgi:hypothetical protein